MAQLEKRIFNLQLDKTVKNEQSKYMNVLFI